MNKAEKILQQVKAGYNQIAEHFASTRAKPWDEFELFRQYIACGQKILDIGCGSGRLFFSFLKDFEVEYYGVDNSEKLIEIAKERISNFQFPISKKIPISNFQIADITALPHPDNFFDLVICIATFHHLPTKELRLKALTEIYRVLKPGSYLLMTNWHLWHQPFFNHFFNQFFKKISLKDFFIPWKSHLGQIQCQRYYHAFTKRELKGLFKKANFQIERIFLHQNSRCKVYCRGIDAVSIVKK